MQYPAVFAQRGRSPALGDGGLLNFNTWNFFSLSSNQDSLAVTKEWGHGGAIFVSSDMTIEGSHFEGNKASEGGAIYANIASTALKVANTKFVGNGGSVGGAISVLGTNSDFTYVGVVQLSNVTAESNTVTQNDGTKEGGAFANVNGGDVYARGLVLRGNKAKGKRTSGLVFRYSTVDLYNV